MLCLALLKCLPIYFLNIFFFCQDVISSDLFHFSFLIVLKILFLVQCTILTKMFSSVQSLSCVRRCDPMNRSMPGLPVDHHHPEFTQTHVHRVRDAIQPSHPRSSPSPPAPSLSVVTNSLWPHESQHARPPSITNSWSLPKLMSIESMMPPNHLILCRPLLLLLPIPPSIRVFSNESTLHEVAKVLEFQLQHQSFQWTPSTDLL